MWSDSETKILKDLWRRGLTASQISLHIPGKTRNACIGRAHRLNLKARGKSKTPTQRVNTENSVVPEAKTQKLGRKARFKALLLDSSFPPERPTKLEDLGDEHCRWPLSGKNEPASLFCGRKPLEQENTGKKYPYCRLHLLFAYVSTTDKEEDQITAEDVHKFIDKSA